MKIFYNTMPLLQLARYKIPLLKKENEKLTFRMGLGISKRPPSLDAGTSFVDVAF